MDIPENLRAAIEAELEGQKPADLKRTVASISAGYKTEGGKGKRLINDEALAACYSAFRMPATFGAVSDALGYTLEFYKGEIGSVTDIGAGSGAATWAVFEMLGQQVRRFSCLEREKAMRATGERLMEADPELKAKAEYEEFDLLKDKIGGKADLVISSYVLNELQKEDLKVAVEKMWEATEDLLVIVEPGTPAGFEVIKEIRSELKGLGGNLVAPCPHDGECRLKKDDWCHFTFRIQRSRLHKLIKDADVPYEDEKYSFIAFSKRETGRANMRVLRHPYITKGQIGLNVCTAEEIREITVRKRDGELYKKARKCKQGDSL